jgi:hypothetical protein
MAVTLSEEEKRRLDTDGLAVAGSALFGGIAWRRCANALPNCLRTWASRLGLNSNREPQTDRLANLVNYGELFQQVIAEPKVLACVEHVLGPEFKLGSLNVRSVRPRSDWMQPLHCDMGALPDARGNYGLQCDLGAWMISRLRMAHRAMCSARIVAGNCRRRFWPIRARRNLMKFC